MSEHVRPRRNRAVLLSLLVLIGCCSTSLAQQQHHERVFGAYFEEFGTRFTGYNISDVQKSGVADQLDYLLYAFGNVTSSSTPACVIVDPAAAYRDSSVPSVNGKPYLSPPYGHFGALLQLKQLHPSLKVLISLGGQLGNASGWVTASQTPEGRAALVSSCIDIFVKGNIAPGVQAPGLFDGFNIDWEFPAAADKDHFTALLKEFRTQLNALSKETHTTYMLSFDSPALPHNYANIDLKAAAAQVDFLTIDGYDYAGESDQQTDEASPLYKASNNAGHAKALSIDETVRAYLDAGVPPEKYLMGFPIYAVGWTGVPNVNHGLYQDSTGVSPVLLADGSGLCPKADKTSPSPGCDSLLTPGTLTYSTIEHLIDKNGYTAWFDAERDGATLYNPITRTFYTYDNPASVAVKTAFIRKHGLGGAYVWALGQDDANGSLTKAIAAGMK
jgi:chitinase